MFHSRLVLTLLLAKSKFVPNMQDHPNIVKALEVYDNKKQIYVVLELCDGGDLYTRAPYSEKASASIVGKLLSAIKYMVCENERCQPYSIWRRMNWAFLTIFVVVASWGLSA